MTHYGSTEASSSKVTERLLTGIPGGLSSTGKVFGLPPSSSSSETSSGGCRLRLDLIIDTGRLPPLALEFQPLTRPAPVLRSTSSFRTWIRRGITNAVELKTVTQNVPTPCRRDTPFGVISATAATTENEDPTRPHVYIENISCLDSPKRGSMCLV